MGEKQSFSRDTGGVGKNQSFFQGRCIFLAKRGTNNSYILLPVRRYLIPIPSMKGES